MSSYPTPRRVVLAWADTQSLTVLEQARACVLAGVKPADAGKLMRRYASGEAEPEEILAGATLFYAIAYELELRRTPGLAWDEAQSWDVKVAVGEPDPMIEAEARARVETSIATGLPPSVAGELTMAEISAYNAVRAESNRPRTRARRR